MPEPADPQWQSSVRRQIEEGLAFMRSRYGAQQFLLYFQAYSNTFAPVDRLRGIYDFALGCGSFVELIVSTRPDCVNPQVAALLASYRGRVQEVWVELGLQSAQERTLKWIGRGHTVTDFDRAFGLLRARGLRLAVHLIFGLPGENLEDIQDTIRHVAALRPDAVKIHNLHVCRDSPLLAEYLAGEVTVPSALRHLGYVVQALELLPPQTIVMRLTCDTPPERLIAPRHFPDKNAFLQSVRRALRDRRRPEGYPGEATLSLPRRTRP
jgi:radical SAM protein (TIGR01212 family)